MSNTVFHDLVAELLAHWNLTKANGGHTLTLDEVSSSWLSDAQKALDTKETTTTHPSLIDGDTDVVIFSASELARNDGSCFWSSEKGWVRLGLATRYDLAGETTASPDSCGPDARWVSYNEALAFAETFYGRKYVAGNGVTCPTCQQQQFACDPIEIDGGTASQQIYCPECDSGWTDIYQLVSISNLELSLSED